MTHRRSIRLGVAAALGTLLAAGASGCTSLVNAEQVSAVSKWSVVGYAEAGATSAHQLDADRAGVTTVGVDGVNVTDDGASVTSPKADTLQLLRQAHARHRPAELLVGNFDDRIGDFSPAIGDKLLGSPAHIDAVTKTLAAEVHRHHWDGVTIDLESLTSSYPSGLTHFVTLLKKRLGVHESVSICLMATTDDYASLGYNLAAIGRAADHVVLMAYDQHGPTWTSAGPVGGTPWVKATLAPLLKAIPHQKIELGIAGYGYTWPRHGTGTQLSDTAARTEAKQSATGAIWDTHQQEWHATTRTGTVLWWSDAQTFRARAAYARSEHLGGVAVWSLGLSDTIPTTR